MTTRWDAGRRELRVAGTRDALAVLDVARTVAGPASYPTGGFEVDLSASYSRILAVLGAVGDDGRIYEPTSIDAPPGRFTLRARNPRAAATPTGANAAPAVTTQAGIVGLTVTANTIGLSAPNGTAQCIPGCTNDHTTAASFMVNSENGGITKRTLVATVPAPLWTGDPIAAAVAAEVPALTNLSTSTITYALVARPA